jgi:Nitroreductase family
MTTTTERLVDRQVEQVLLEAATRAPSVHNSQPWRFAVGPRRIAVHADPGRQLRVADAPGRALLVSCGAAVMNLRVAAEHLGFHPRVRVLPAPDDPTLVAVLDVDHRHSGAGGLGVLYPAVAARRTNRYPFADRRVPHSVLAEVIEAVDLERGVLRVYDDQAEVDRVVGLIRVAELDASLTLPAAAAERADWVGRHREGEGVPAASLGPRADSVRAPFRDLAPGPDPDRERVPFETTPTIAVLSTLTDQRADWVRAGMALERALLVLTRAGVSASFMNQPVELPDLRWLLRSPLTGLGQTQMVLRIGYGPPVPPAPRRALTEVVVRSAEG